uniref:Uncharacterized protein n=1 Tax=Arundo donax TaxID=35708 RepID=A0A0A9DFN5_ARUDO
MQGCQHRSCVGFQRCGPSWALYGAV